MGVEGCPCSVEGFAIGAETARSIGSPIVDDTHRLVSLVARQLNLIVLNNILLNDCHSRLLALRLVDHGAVEVNCWNEAIVTWNMLGHFSGAHAQLVCFILSLGSIKAQDVTWVVSLLSEGVGELGEVSAACGSVRLPINRPEWSARFDFIHGIDLIINCFCIRDPVIAWLNVLGHGLTRRRQGHLFEGLVL